MLTDIRALADQFLLRSQISTLIPYLSAIVPNIPDRGVVRDSDSFIDSYIVPLSCIGLAEQYYLANITMHGRSLVSQ